MIKRKVENLISKRFFKKKAIIVIGARQTGKSTLIENLIAKKKKEITYFNGDESTTNDLLANITLAKISRIIGKSKIIFFDEAQKIANIGTIIKIIVDKIKDVQVIASGSSSFELMNALNEPLTGRKYNFELFPLSYGELNDHFGYVEEFNNLESRLIYGSYPEVVANPVDARELLKLIAESYLYKDLLILDNIQKPVLLQKIVKALAFQIGSEVNYTEISGLVGASKATVEKYIDVLEKAYIVFKLPAISKNVRNEIKKGQKIYFYDVGVRNTVIADFRPLNLRTDTGALWENYLISERKKLLSYNNSDRERYFWRTTQQQEIDYIETRYDKYYTYEFKWNPNKKVRLSKTFASAYPNHTYKVITPQNYDEFLLEI